MPTYRETVALLTERLPMFSRIGQQAIKSGLDNIIELCAALDQPQQKFPAIHIAGTNGKGSTSHMIAAALQQAGYRTGLYTSPHLVDLRERIRINGIPVSESFVISFVEKMRPLFDSIEPSYFELNVAMAFAAFAEEKVDVAVVETGLGGRLDSTNILDPVLSVITNIGLDHTQILGDTLPQIAREKAGIIKEKVPVVVGETQAETEQVFFLAALNKHTSVVYADSLWDLVRVKQDADYQYYKAIHKGEQKMYDLKTDLLGSYQAHNIKTVLASCDLLQQMGWRLDRDQVLKSMEQVKTTTGLRGRWERLRQQPEIVLDVAHNAEGMSFLAANLAALRASGAAVAGLRIVCGFVRDKDVAQALALFPTDAVYYFTQANVPRAMPFDELASIAEQGQLQGKAYPTVADALAAARDDAGAEDVILITGSFFIVGEAIAILEQRVLS
ncbi:bifunctional folylpolyglutamate synthase/dihydrofolate synthase [Taibaiella helva]|uniref:bifunctional folylpolyglutamate synthase/dihydrofolate synthase n=1 Tax=Taibaiella helva TaxID=2301235 RepID=UPI001E48BA50|nr:folylpolyglutamate synthase/dihydrofolate synthase family protein [Taibaiella helva]